MSIKTKISYEINMGTKGFGYLTNNELANLKTMAADIFLSSGGEKKDIDVYDLLKHALSLLDPEEETVDK